MEAAFSRKLIGFYGAGGKIFTLNFSTQPQPSIQAQFVNQSYLRTQIDIALLNIISQVCVG